MKQAFTAVMAGRGDVDGAYVEIPFDVEAVFGAKRVKVKAWFDGAPYRGSIVRMAGCYMLGVPKAIRSVIGKNPGDTVQVEVEKDEEERSIELPEDFQSLLKENPEAHHFFESLSYTGKKDYCQWIETAKKAETRTARLQKALELLAQGKKLK